jgi:hypothetical protein
MTTIGAAGSNNQFSFGLNVFDMKLNINDDAAFTSENLNTGNQSYWWSTLRGGSNAAGQFIHTELVPVTLTGSPGVAPLCTATKPYTCIIYNKSFIEQITSAGSGAGTVMRTATISGSAVTQTIGDNGNATSITNIVGGSAANTQANGSAILTNAIAVATPTGNWSFTPASGSGPNVTVGAGQTGVTITTPSDNNLILNVTGGAASTDAIYMQNAGVTKAQLIYVGSTSTLEVAPLAAAGNLVLGYGLSSTGFTLDNSGGLSAQGATGAGQGQGTVNSKGMFVNGTALNPVLSATTASIGGGALVAGACASTATTVTGAAVGMVANATPNTYPGDSSFWKAYVSGANTVTTLICEAVAGTPTASTYNLRVLQ